MGLEADAEMPVEEFVSPDHQSEMEIRPPMKGDGATRSCLSGAEMSLVLREDGDYAGARR